MKALIIGATGATGKDLVRVLLQDNNYTEVVAFVRCITGLVHPKYLEIITDFDKIESVSEKIKGDVWFSCLGTTLKAAGSKTGQWRIDHDIPLEFARFAKNHGVSTAVVISAHGASATSKVFYSRMKGALDEAIADLNFDRCIIFKPGMLLRENTDRASERLIGNLLKFVNQFGLAKKFRPLPTAILAGKLAKAPTLFQTGKHIIELDHIFDV